MEGQVVFPRVLWFSLTFDEWLAQYKWNILERAVKPKSVNYALPINAFIFEIGIKTYFPPFNTE